jgi:hypothetical protein
MRLELAALTALTSGTPAARNALELGLRIAVSP